MDLMVFLGPVQKGDRENTSRTMFVVFLLPFRYFLCVRVLCLQLCTASSTCASLPAPDVLTFMPLRVGASVCRLLEWRGLYPHPLYVTADLQVLAGAFGVDAT